MNDMTLFHMFGYRDPEEALTELNLPRLRAHWNITWKGFHQEDQLQIAEWLGLSSIRIGRMREHERIIWRDMKDGSRKYMISIMPRTLGNLLDCNTSFDPRMVSWIDPRSEEWGYMKRFWLTDWMRIPEADAEKIGNLLGLDYREIDEAATNEDQTIYCFCNDGDQLVSKLFLGPGMSCKIWTRVQFEEYVNGLIKGIEKV